MLNCVRFDWFSFTIKNKSIENVFSDLGLDFNEFSLTHGRYGYNRMYVHNRYDISVLYEGTEQMGIHVSISGSSINFFMDCFVRSQGCKCPFGGYVVEDKDVFHAFARYVFSCGKFSRVDVNFDTDNDFLNPFNIRDMIDNGFMISKYRSWKFIEKSDKAATIYLGQRNSSSFVRIYDKAKEQGDYKGKLFRFEIQFNKGCNDFMSNFLESGLIAAFVSFIQKQLRFVEDHDYHKKSMNGWSLFLSSICSSEVLTYKKYESKTRKNSIDSLFHMFKQYKYVFFDFFDNYGNVDDFIEFLFFVGNCNDELDIIKYLNAKGW